MSTNGDTGDGISILSFDSGGPGTYSQLLILKEYMSRLAADLGIPENNVYPADYFDLMGGVGFGGLVALVLGHFHLSVDEAIDTLLDVGSAIFHQESQQPLDLELNTGELREAIESILQRRDVPLETKMNDPDRPPVRCKVALYAASSARINHPQTFRTYPSRGSSLNPTIVEAICATMAIPSHFSSVKIGPRLRQQNYVGGAIGANNPTRELLREASNVFGKDRRVAQILSVGSGLPRVLSLESSTKEAGLGRLAKDLAVDCETVAQELHTRLYNVQAYLRLNVDRGMENVVMEDWSELGEIACHTGAYIAAASVSESIDTSLGNVRGKVGTVTLGQLNQSSSIKILAKTVPSVSPHFVARTKPWTLMVHQLVMSTSFRQRIFPITGMGGCGKTQMVSYFLQEHPSLYAKVAVVDGSSSVSIRSDLQAWAQAAGDGHEQDVWEDAIRMLTSIPLNERWLLIIDNADDPTLNLVPFIPKSPNLTVIITSRNRDLGDLSTTYHLELGEMEEEEALATLMQAARRQGPLNSEELKSAKTLAKELGYLAVALVQAGTYCHQLSSEARGVLHPYTFTQYLSLFYLHRAELMKKVSPSSLDNYQRGVYTTLDLSYQVIPQASREFLHFLSFFHHTDIPLEALASAANKGFADRETSLERPASHLQVVSELTGLLCVDGSWNELQVQDTIRTLRAFSLVSVTSMNDRIFMQLHPLVQAWSRDMVSSDSQRYHAMVTQIITSSSCRDNVLLLHRYILPHVIEILGQVKVQDLHVNDLVAAGSILLDQGQYHKASGLFEAGLEKMTSCAEASAEETLDVTLSLASSYWREGRLSAAEKLQLEVLEKRKDILGLEHLNTILATAHLALTYLKQGRYSEAEKLGLEVLEQRTKTLGLEHLDTITSAANLAAIYTSQGRHSEAKKLELEVLERQKLIQGSEHPNTMLAAANLSATYWQQGRYSEAEKLGLEVLEQRTKTLGPEHPDTVISAASLAAIYSSQGRHSKAEKLKLEVLELQKKILGSEHPNTILAAANLALTYWQQGRYSEAEKLGSEVLEQRRRTLGSEHPDTIMSAANLASTYSSQGRHNEAEKLGLEVLEQRRTTLGLDHPHTIISASNLASTYSLQGRYSEAEKLQLEALERRQMILGLEHPDTILAAGNLALIYWQQGRYSEAEKLGLEVLEQRRTTLGSDHPDTIMSAANLASTYSSQGRHNEAEKLKLEVLERRQMILGFEHPDTIRAAANLSFTIESQGRWSEAVELLAPTVKLGLRVLGQQHPNTQGYIGGLVNLYEQLGQQEEAEETRKLLLS